MKPVPRSRVVAAVQTRAVSVAHGANRAGKKPRGSGPQSGAAPRRAFEDEPYGELQETPKGNATPGTAEGEGRQAQGNQGAQGRRNRKCVRSRCRSNRKRCGK